MRAIYVYIQYNSDIPLRFQALGLSQKGDENEEMQKKALILERQSCNVLTANVTSVKKNFWLSLFYGIVVVILIN